MKASLFAPKARGLQIKELLSKNVDYFTIFHFFCPLSILLHSGSQLPAKPSFIDEKNH